MTDDEYLRARKTGITRAKPNRLSNWQAVFYFCGKLYPLAIR